MIADNILDKALDKIYKIKKIDKFDGTLRFLLKQMINCQIILL